MLPELSIEKSDERRVVRAAKAFAFGDTSAALPHPKSTVSS
jgi:hypothetical protein